MSSTLSSASTYAQVLAAYDDNASYAEDGDAGKARAFVTACRFLLRLPKRSAHGGKGEEIEFDPAVIRAEKADAEAWLAREARRSAGTRYTSFANFRD